MYWQNDLEPELIDNKRLELTPLDARDFKEYLNETLNFKSGGYEYIFKFNNGYGARVIKRVGTQGAHLDLFELSLIKKGNKFNPKFYTQNRTYGYLNNDQVLNLLTQIKDFVPIETVTENSELVAEKLRLVINKE